MCYKLICIAFLCLMLACDGIEESRTVNDEPITFVDSVVFDTDILFRSNFSGSYISKDTHYYYFADPVSAKKIQLFKNKGQLIAEVNLQDVLKNGESLHYVNVIAPDTIIAISKYSNRLYVLNRQGAVWKQMDLLRHLPSHPLYSYEARATTEDILFDGNHLLLSYYIGFKESVSSEKTYLDLLAYEWKSPYFIKLENIWSDSVTTQSGFALHRQVYPHDSVNLVLGPKQYVIAGSSLVVSSNYSDQIFELDLESLQLMNKKKVVSRHDSFVEIPMNAEKLGFEVAFDSAITRVFKTPTISGLMYNEALKHYYVFVVKRLKRPFDPLKTRVPFIMQAYDKELNQLLDLNVDINKYAGVVLPTQKGFMLQTRASSGNFKNKKAVFHEFRY